MESQYYVCVVDNVDSINQGLFNLVELYQRLTHTTNQFRLEIHYMPCDATEGLRRLSGIAMGARTKVTKGTEGRYYVLVRTSVNELSYEFIREIDKHFMSDEHAGADICETCSTLGIPNVWVHKDLTNLRRSPYLVEEHWRTIQGVQMLEVCLQKLTSDSDVHKRSWDKRVVNFIGLLRKIMLFSGYEDFNPVSKFLIAESLILKPTEEDLRDVRVALRSVKAYVDSMVMNPDEGIVPPTPELNVSERGLSILIFSKS